LPSRLRHGIIAANVVFLPAPWLPACPTPALLRPFLPAITRRAPAGSV